MTAYRKGRYGEMVVVNEAFSAGCLAVWSPGSHGCDVFVTAHGGIHHWAVNVKRGRWAPPEERRDHLLFADYGWRPILARVELVGGTGPGSGPRRLEARYAIVTKDGAYDPLLGQPWA